MRTQAHRSMEPAVGRSQFTLYQSRERVPAAAESLAVGAPISALPNTSLELTMEAGGSAQDVLDAGS
jgi:hypothetical protein